MICSAYCGLFIDGCSTRCPKNRARLKILHSCKIDQDITVMTFFTFNEWRKNVKQNEDLGEGNQEVEVREKIARKHSTF